MNQKVYEFLRSLKCHYQVIRISKSSICKIDTGYGSALFPTWDIGESKCVNIIRQVYTKSKDIFSSWFCLYLFERDESNEMGCGAIEGNLRMGQVECIFFLYGQQI